MSKSDEPIEPDVMEISCDKCGAKLTLHRFHKPFSFKERKASTAIVDCNGEVMVSYTSQYGVPTMTNPNKIKAIYVLAALNAYKPPKEATDND